jgi:hypothetical protein
LEQCFKIDKEGEQVLASLVNVAQRLPLLSSSSNEEVEEEKNNKINTSIQNLGILTQCHGIGQLLIQKHFLSLEKSMAFFHDIMYAIRYIDHTIEDNETNILILLGKIIKKSYIECKLLLKNTFIHSRW